jgi:thiol-disulfide isomerase/thioredoxin
MLSIAALLAAVIAAVTGPSIGPVVGAADWIHGKVTAAQLQGKVVLVDFYTFDCINCKHTEPNLRSLYANTPRKDLVIIGVHCPETSYERDRANLIASLSDQGIAWPVVVDNDFKVWNAYGVTAWPTQMVFDRHGVLRQTFVGEGYDSELDSLIASLITEH